MKHQPIQHLQRQLQQLDKMSGERIPITSPNGLAAITRIIDDWSSSKLLAINNMGSRSDIVSADYRELIFIVYPVRTIHRSTYQKQKPTRDPAVSSVPKPRCIYRDVPRYPPGPRGNDPFTAGTERDVELEGYRKTVNCSSCRGKGVIKCSNCRGRGVVKCSSCNGSGHKIEMRGPTYPLKRVRVDCYRCRGSRTVDCSNCSGKGQRKCTECNGLGLFLHQTFLQTEYQISSYADYMYSGGCPLPALIKSKENFNSISDGVILDYERDNRFRLASILGGYPVADEAKMLARYLKSFDAKSYFTPAQGKIHLAVGGVFKQPLTTVRYLYEDKPYTLYLIGPEGSGGVYAKPRPSRSKEFFRNIFARLGHLFTFWRRKPKESPWLPMLEACVWMCWADGNLHQAERELLADFIESAELPDLNKEQLAASLESRPTEINLRGRLARKEDIDLCLKLVWQVVLVDGEVDANEQTTFDYMCAQLGVDASRRAKIMNAAYAELTAWYQSNTSVPVEQASAGATQTDQYPTAQAEHYPDEQAEQWPEENHDLAAQAIVDALAAAGDWMRMVDIKATTGLDAPEARSSLHALIEAGAVEKTGRASGTKYRLHPHTR